MVYAADYTWSSTSDGVLSDSTSGCVLDWQPITLAGTVTISSSAPQLLLPFLLLIGGSLAEVVPTFEYRDPNTGEVLTCEKCPPGTHMAARCTATTQTQCVPCKEQHFTELYNYLPRCLYCNNFCTDNQEVETECSAVKNRVCRCKEGFYWANDFCIRHSECEPGQGVQTKGMCLSKDKK